MKLNHQKIEMFDKKHNLCKEYSVNKILSFDWM